MTAVVYAIAVVVFVNAAFAVYLLRDFRREQKAGLS